MNTPLNSIRRAIPLIASLTFLALAANSSADEKARQVINDWIGAQKTVKSLEVTFVQDRKLRGLKKPLRSTGKFWLSRPNKMRWQVGDPIKTLAIYTDDTATVLRPGKGEFRQRKAGSSDDTSETERMFLQSGLPESLAEFEEFAEIGDVTKVESNPALTGVSLTLKDRRAASAVNELILFIDERNQNLAGYEIKFRDQSEVLTRFSKINKNPNIDSSLFKADTSGLEEVAWDAK